MAYSVPVTFSVLPPLTVKPADWATFASPVTRLLVPLRLSVPPPSTAILLPAPVEAVGPWNEPAVAVNPEFTVTFIVADVVVNPSTFEEAGSPATVWLLTLNRSESAVIPEALMVIVLPGVPLKTAVFPFVHVDSDQFAVVVSQLPLPPCHTNDEAETMLRV